MSDLLVRPRAQGSPGEPLVAVTPTRAGWRHIGFEAHRLDAGETREWRDPERELCLVVLGGTADVAAGDRSWPALGERTTVFDGLPSAAYVPAGIRCAVTARSPALEVALAWAPDGDGGGEPAVIRPDEVEVEVRGRGAMERRIHPILMEERRAHSLLVVEVLTPGGHWSSYPPHRHDRDAPPDETLLEETYYHRVSPAHGFGLQRVYSDDGTLDETVAFGDGDVVLVPRGYHTVSAPPGYDLYYLNVMAGPVRRWSITTDPAHEWLLG